ncbi:F-box protein PP2-B10 [Brachypodium distachyon]|uniref:F-box protein PP2-B10 n=1 Tax=Brachypodium distachyon TaxID=15368 RepID=UPI000D0DF911|nr:F-box protein PP2-B10 [Brachypodium distachyon]|eukprot:XP_014756608.2 F-box protein PP2-B10 [Brachypodium distachyon]
MAQSSPRRNVQKHTMEMETPAAAGCECECEIDRLPEELLVQVISLTSPRDAFCAAAVSRDFQAAADSDAVWSRFLPGELPRFAKGVLPKPKPTTPPMSKKALFERLSGQPALLPQKSTRMQLDRATGAEWFTLSASGMQILRRRYFTTIRVDPSRCTTRGRSVRIPSQVLNTYCNVYIGFYLVQRNTHQSVTNCFEAQLQTTLWKSCTIGAKVQSKVLPRNTTYAAYMVFKLPGKFYGLDFPYQEASIAVGGSESTVTRQVCLQGYIDDEDQKHVLPGHYGIIRHPEGVPPGGEVVFPRRRDDGWMEVELGEFRNDGGGDDEVSMCLKDGHTGTMIGLLNPRRSKLVLWAIELRSKQRKTTILYD